jgi:hypothetical protein
MYSLTEAQITAGQAPNSPRLSSIWITGTSYGVKRLPTLSAQYAGRQRQAVGRHQRRAAKAYSPMVGWSERQIKLVAPRFGAATGPSLLPNDLGKYLRRTRPILLGDLFGGCLVRGRSPQHSLRLGQMLSALPVMQSKFRRIHFSIFVRNE